MSNQKLIILRGYPGSGKTTSGKMLEAEKYGIFIDHNKILSFISKIVGNDTGIYDEINELEKSMADKLLNDGSSVIVARGFSSANSIKPYLDIATQSGAKTYIFRLAAKKSTLAIRVTSKERLKDLNPTTSKRALLEWIVSNPIEQFKGEHIIDADKPMPDMLGQIKSTLGSRPSRG